MSERTMGRVATLLALLLVPTGALGLSGQTVKLRQTLDFAVEMARKGNWREARYRWGQADSSHPGNARILNNLAVACEVLGDAEAAEGYYDRARALAPRDAVIDHNMRRFGDYLRELREPGTDPKRAPADGMDSRSAARRRPARSDTIRVVANFPLPPRLDLTGFESLLVASFRTEDSDLVDTNREITRFLRSEFSKRGSLQVVEATPAPAIPEQTIEDLLANHEFWKHLGREWDADLIVSGVVSYTRKEVSGFQDVDVVSPITGQKVRETRFVEQEQFTYAMDVFFIDGATGELHFRDRLQRSAVYPGTTNDALSAFYGLVESIAKDVLAVVSPRVREDVRIIYRD